MFRSNGLSLLLFVTTILSLSTFASAQSTRWSPPDTIYRDPCISWNPDYDYCQGWADHLFYKLKDYYRDAITNNTVYFTHTETIQNGGVYVAKLKFDVRPAMWPVITRIDNPPFVTGPYTIDTKEYNFTFASWFQEFHEIQRAKLLPSGTWRDELNAVANSSISIDVDLTIKQTLGNTVVNTIVEKIIVCEYAKEYETRYWIHEQSPE